MKKIKLAVGNTIQRFRKYSVKKKIALFGVPLMATMIAIPVITYASYAHDISDPDRLMNHNNTGVALLDKNGEIFYSRGVVRNFKEAKISDISAHVQKALLASEDKNFYTNPGFSISGTFRALFNNVKEQDATGSGGSGITQQLVKNNLLTSDKNYFRKYQELSMAIAIERHYSKDEILEMYLNSVYFGSDAFGIERAAEVYFNKSAKHLDLAESAMLIGLLPAPSAYSPISGDKEMAKERQTYVLERMEEDRHISANDKQAAEDKALTYHTPASEADGYAHHFALMVIEELNKKYGEERITRSGFRVTTSLDSGWQKTAEDNVYKQVQTLSRQDARNGSLVAIDPTTGEIRALVGSADWDNKEYGKVNMATSPRQPGSSFKPIYYTEAINTRKVTAATVLHDKPTDFGGGYKPTNYDFKYRGDVSTRYALANSLNIPAVEVMEKVGVTESVKTAQRMGISTIDKPETYGLSLALGTAEARLTDMTNAYAALAKQGDQYPITTIGEIKDKFDNSVYKNKLKAKRVMSKEASFIMSSILSDEKARAPLAGTKFNIGRPAAVKTGTTNDERDAWTIGYTPQVAIGVWVGNNDNTPMKGVGGSLGAGPIWRNTISSFLKNTKAESFSVPAGVIQASVCNTTSSQQEYFIRGTEAQFKCTEKPKDEKKEDPKKREEEKKPEKTEKPKPGSTGTTDETDSDDGEETPTEPPDDEEEPTEPTDPAEPVAPPPTTSP